MKQIFLESALTQRGNVLSSNIFGLSNNSSMFGTFYLYELETLLFCSNFLSIYFKQLMSTGYNSKFRLTLNVLHLFPKNILFQQMIDKQCQIVIISFQKMARMKFESLFDQNSLKSFKSKPFWCDNHWIFEKNLRKSIEIWLPSQK